MLERKTMAVIDLDKTYKTVCKYCGLVKQSKVPGNFVCKDCKKFCEQQLSGEELLVRNNELNELINNSDDSKYSFSEDLFICKICRLITNGYFVSNQQYLSVCRILKKENK